MIEQELILRETDLWVWSLFPNQCQVGRVQLTLVRQCDGWLHDLTDAEWAEFKLSLDDYRALVHRHFQPTHYNVFQFGNIWRQVHAHLVPRYDGRRHWNGAWFTDPTWGADPSLDRTSPIDKMVTRQFAAWWRDELAQAMR